MNRLNSEEWGWNPANTPGEFVVPDDLVPYYRQVKDGYWGYVCPSCKNAMAPGWGPTIPADFRAHIKPHLEGRGCFFNPKGVAGGGR